MRRRRRNLTPKQQRLADACTAARFRIETLAQGLGRKLTHDYIVGVDQLVLIERFIGMELRPAILELDRLGKLLEKSYTRRKDGKR